MMRSATSPWLVLSILFIAASCVAATTSSSSSDHHPYYNLTVPQRRLAIVIPFTPKSIRLLARSISLWSGPDFTPCVPSFDHLADEEVDDALNAHDAQLPSGMASRYPPSMVDIFLTSSEDEDRLGDDIQQVVTALQGHEHNGGISPITCFGRIQVIFSSTPKKWDNPERGGSFMFYDLFSQEPLKQYHYVFVMDADVIPVRPGWVEALYQHIVTDDSWVIGSALRACPDGSLLADDVKCDHPLAGSLHIGANALYSMSPDFAQVVAAIDVSTRSAAAGSYVAYDRAIYSYLSSRASSWPANIHRYRYTDLIQNTLQRSREVAQAILDGDLSTPPQPVYEGTYLLHVGRLHIEEVLEVLIPHNRHRIAEQLADDQRVAQQRQALYGNDDDYLRYQDDEIIRHDDL